MGRWLPRKAPRQPERGPLAPPGKVIGGGPAGEWFHAFNPRRAIPDSIVSKGWFEAADRTIAYTWRFSTILLLIAGVVLALRDPARRRGAVLLLIPLATFMAATCSR